MKRRRTENLFNGNNRVGNHVQLKLQFIKERKWKIKSVINKKKLLHKTIVRAKLVAKVTLDNFLNCCFKYFCNLA